MSNPDDTEVSKIAPGEDNLEEVSTTYFLSKITMENNQDEDDDKEIHSILYTEDDDYIPKTELDNDIEKLIEKLQSPILVSNSWYKFWLQVRYELAIAIGP